MKICTLIFTNLTISLYLLIYPAISNAESTNQMTVAVIQLQTTDVGNFTKMKSLVQQAKSYGAQLVIFPEDSVFGWLNPEVFTQADYIPGKYSNQFAAIAKDENIWIAAGLGEKGPKAGPGSLSSAYYAYDSAILINPSGQIVLHHRKYNVLKNAFDPAACKRILNENECSYTPGEISDITTVNTPFGKTSMLVCSDTFTYPTDLPLSTLKNLQPDFVIVPWGVTASTQAECGAPDFNATDFAANAAMQIQSALVIGANAVGPRNYGKYLPSVYCGTSGYAYPSGQKLEATQPLDEIVLFKINKNINILYTPIIYTGKNYAFNGPLNTTVDPTGNIWVTNQQGNSITKLAAANPNTPIVYSDAKYKINQPVGITSDTVGNIWFTNASGENITEIPATNPNNPINYSGASYGFNIPYGITSDKMGNIWVLNILGNSVTKIPASNPNNPIVYSGPKYGFNYPYGIAADPIGNIWITNAAANSITELPINNAASPVIYSNTNYKFNYPYAITSDNIGNIWVVNRLGNSVTKIPYGNVNNPVIYSGAIYGFSNPDAIAYDILGNIWVSNQLNNTITKLPVNFPAKPVIYSGSSSFSTPGGLAADNKGNVWVTNYFANNMTELRTSSY